MPLQRSKEELLAHYDEIAESIRQNHEPVYITDEHGGEDLVLLPAELFHRLAGGEALERLLAGALAESASGEKHPEVDVLAELEKPTFS